MSKPHSFPRTALIGMGNINRGDDGVGIYICNYIREKFSNFDIHTEDIIPLDEIVLDLINNNNISNVIFIDAVENIDSIYEWFDDPNSFERIISSHKASLPTYMAILLKGGKKVRLLGVKPFNIGFDNSLSSELKRFIDSNVIDLLSEKISELNSN